MQIEFSKPGELFKIHLIVLRIAYECLFFKQNCQSHMILPMLFHGLSMQEGGSYPSQLAFCFDGIILEFNMPESRELGQDSYYCVHQQHLEKCMMGE